VKRDICLPELLYQAIKMVSPMMFGEEQKDQDRARFIGPGLVGIVCDGVTSSPRSGNAAELVTSFAPILFEGDAHERLRTVCDLLMAYREEFQTAHLAVPGDMPEAMQTMLREVLRDKQATSYQTTIVAVRLRPGKSDVGVDILRCGDSAIFAFSGDGELLHSSLTHPSGHEVNRHHPFLSDGLRFGPGDQILVRVEGPLDDHESVAMNSGIHERHFRNWLVCTPVDAPSGVETAGSTPSGVLVIAPGDQLLVPKYLYGRQLTSPGHKYRCLDYSSTIRIVPTSPPGVLADGIEHRSSVTTVLPDHFYSGHYDSIEDRFPCGTHFVLCSDGFYSAFATASGLWAWLQESRDAIGDAQEREKKLRDLHERLHAKGGDDDMSFVWMYPTPAAAPAREGVAREREE
jgi:hypothetical protein